MTPLEINAAGRPVIAFRGGGALETVVESVTGVFFNEPNADSLVQAIESFETLEWNSAAIRAHALRFDQTVFAERLLEFLATVAPAVQLSNRGLRSRVPASQTASAPAAAGLSSLLPQSS